MDLALSLCSRGGVCIWISSRHVRKSHMQGNQLKKKPKNTKQNADFAQSELAESYQLAIGTPIEPISWHHSHFRDWGNSQARPPVMKVRLLAHTPLPWGTEDSHSPFNIQQGSRLKRSQASFPSSLLAELMKDAM